MDDGLLKQREWEDRVSLIGLFLAKFINTAGIEAR